MNARRVRSSIIGLEKDITKCEMMLSKVIKGKIDKSKPTPQKCQSTVVTSRERSALTRAKSPEKSLELTTKPISHKVNSAGNRVLCKEIIENDGATVEVTVKTKSSGDRSRKRARSNTLVPPTETDGLLTKNYSKKAPNLIHDPPAPTKLHKRTQVAKKIQHHLTHKPLSWGHILKDSDIPCIVHSEKSNVESRRLPLHLNSKNSPCTSKQECKHFHVNDSVNRTDIIETSCSSDEESVHYVNRSVQCCLLNKEKVKIQKKIHLSKFTAGDNGSSSFSIFNPVRTLNFLIKELHGKIEKCDADENMKRIIIDIEQALCRLPPELSKDEVKEIVSIPARDETVKTKQNQLGFASLKPENLLPSKPVSVLKSTFSEERTKGDKTGHETRLKPPPPKKAESITPPEKDQTQTPVLQDDLEVKCSRLEFALKQLEHKYEEQRKENGSLNDLIKSQKEHFDTVNSREKDYLTTIGYLRSNLEIMTKRVDEQSRSISELSASNTQLKEENKVLNHYRESQCVLNKHLKESTENEEKIRSQLQIMKLEREKFDILLAGKNMELEKFKQELREIQIFVSDQLSSLKSLKFGHKSAHLLNQAFGVGIKSLLTADDSDAESVSLFFEKAQTGGGNEREKKEKQPVCSSPTSSVPSSIGADSSWQKISRISNHSESVEKHPSPEVLVLSAPMKNKMEDSEEEGISLAGNNNIFPIVNSGSPEFKSFLLDSLSENVIKTSSHTADITEPKSCQDLKDELRALFNKLKKEASMGMGLSLPSPPHHYSEMSEPGGMSQWSEVSDSELLQNTAVFSSTIDQLKKITTDVSMNNKSVTSNE